MSYPLLTVTMTTGRRLELFRRTMDSFLANCLDRDMISRWVVSDDRSSREDLEAMQEAYPFLEVHSSPRPGQPASLNHLWSLVRTDWAFHMEDDWETIRAGHFIREALDVARSDHRIRNVVVRARDIDGQAWSGPYVKDGPLEYRYHVRWMRGKLFFQHNDCLYLGYSLNPGLQHIPTVRWLGRYDETATTRFFDRPAAQKYLDAGFIRANLMEGYTKHIGENRGAWEL